MKTKKVECATCNKRFEIYAKKYKPKLPKKLRRQGYKRAIFPMNITKQLPTTHLPKHECKQSKKNNK
jgi:hypothetical protein